MTATIFTFPPHYVIATLAARALHRLGVMAYLAIDHKDPVPAVEDCEVIVTRFQRRGNLNGKECVEGILATLASVADGSPYQLKVDSDTLVRGLAWLDGHLEPAVGLQHTGRRGFFGACYGLRTDLLPAFQKAAAALPDWDKSCPEDETISALLPGRFGYENLTPGCPFAGYSEKKGLSDDEWRQIDVVAFQNNRSVASIRELMLKLT